MSQMSFCGHVEIISMKLCLSSSVMTGRVDKKNGTRVKLQETDPRPKTGIALLKEDCQISGTINNVTPELAVNITYSVTVYLRLCKLI